MELDEAVDGLGAAVARAGGGEVPEEGFAPLLQGPPEAGKLGDRARGERGEDLLDDGPLGSWGVLVVHRADLLGAPPSDLDLDVPLMGLLHG